MKYGMHALLVCVAVVVVLSATSQAQQPQESSYQTISDNFFKILQQGKGAEAVEYITGTNPAMKKIPDQIDNLKAQFGSLGTLMGSYISHTKMVETKIAGMFVYQHYFVAYERQPISVRIKYYKPGATWLCYGVQFDAELVDQIQKEADSRIPIEVN